MNWRDAARNDFRDGLRSFNRSCATSAWSTAIASINEGGGVADASGVAGASISGISAMSFSALSPTVLSSAPLRVCSWMRTHTGNRRSHKGRTNSANSGNALTIPFILRNSARGWRVIGAVQANSASWAPILDAGRIFNNAAFTFAYGSSAGG